MCIYSPAVYIYIFIYSDIFMYLLRSYVLFSWMGFSCIVRALYTEVCMCTYT